MRLSLLVVPALLSLAVNAYAQSGGTVQTSAPAAPREGVVSQVIPEISYLSSTWIAEDAPSLKSKPGLGAGVRIEMGRSNGVFETGLLYRQYGTTASNRGLEEEANFNYLVVPVLAKYYFNGQEQGGLFIKGGLMPSLLVSKEYKQTYAGRTYSTSDLSNVSSVVLDATVGMGFSASLNPTTNFVFDAGYVRGMTSVTSSGRTVTNSVFNIGVGIGFLM
ncbi:MAG: porin family protein [Bdellovibrionales bacterium]